MDIAWLMDTNILIAKILRNDHLHQVVACIDDRKELMVTPAVAAEIRATYDAKMLRVLARYMDLETEIPDDVDLLTKNILIEVRALMENSGTITPERAIEIFRQDVIERMLDKIGFVKSKAYSPRRSSLNEVKTSPDDGPAEVFRKIKSELDKTWKNLVDIINNLFKGSKRSNDREILIELVNTSLLYPNLYLCFLTNDMDFYKKWRRLYKDYEKFKERNDIKCGLIFHYIPDLKTQKLSLYKTCPEVDDEELSLREILQECAKSIGYN